MQKKILAVFIKFKNAIYFLNIKYKTNVKNKSFVTVQKKYLDYAFTNKIMTKEVFLAQTYPTYIIIA